jgi:hypothetical protein
MHLEHGCLFSSHHQHFSTYLLFLRYTVYVLEHFAEWIQCHNQCMRAAKCKAYIKNFETQKYNLLTITWQVKLFLYEMESTSSKCIWKQKFDGLHVEIFLLKKQRFIFFFKNSLLDKLTCWYMCTLPLLCYIAMPQVSHDVIILECINHVLTDVLLFKTTFL